MQYYFKNEILVSARKRHFLGNQDKLGGNHPSRFQLELFKKKKAAIQGL